jgi:hypothetical protein
MWMLMIWLGSLLYPVAMWCLYPYLSRSRSRPGRCIPLGRLARHGQVTLADVTEWSVTQAIEPPLDRL